ncbi:MAG TPA: hypothetical protein VGI78_17400 [Acetobacteraceae bacterium]
MFKGKAELKNPETNATVGTFTETCEDDGTSNARVVLNPAITLSGTERLAIYSTIKDQEVISATATNGASTDVHEFHGKSTVGCIPDQGEVSLTRSPGGPLGTLLVVLGKGTVSEERY